MCSLGSRALKCGLVNAWQLAERVRGSKTHTHKCIHTGDLFDSARDKFNIIKLPYSARGTTFCCSRCCGILVAGGRAVDRSGGVMGQLYICESSARQP